MPISEAIVAERNAITQRRALLRRDRHRSRKTLRREMLRSSLTVWDENHTAEG